LRLPVKHYDYTGLGVNHIQSGRHWMFSTLADVLTFLGRQVEDMGPSSPPPGQ